MSDKVHPLKVVEAHTLTPNTICLLMKPEMPIIYQAGNYIMLGFQQDDLKPFSLASAPREDGLLECHIRRHDNNEWMEKLFAIRPGDHLIMQGPKPQMQLKPALQPVIFVAGGTGFAPMKALLDELLRQGCEVPITFYWGARSAEDLYMHQKMIDLCIQHPNIEYIPVVSDDCKNWTGATGLVHEQVLKDHGSLEHFTVYLCGPWAMTQKAKQDFYSAGLREENFIS